MSGDSIAKKIREIFNSETELNLQVLNKYQNGGNRENMSDSLKDVDKLLSMLTSESNEINYNSETNTENLEVQIRNILNKTRMTGGGSNASNLDYKNVKNFFNQLKSNGVDVNVKLNGGSMSEYFEGNNHNNMYNHLGGGLLSETSSINSDMFLRGGNNLSTTSEMSHVKSRKLMNGGDYSATSTMMSQQMGGNDYSATSSMMSRQMGGGDYSATSSMMSRQMGGDYSATSSMMSRQMGGDYSATSSDALFMKGGNDYSTTTTELSAMNGGNNIANLLTVTSSEMPGFNIKGGNDSLSSEISSINNLSSEMSNYLDSEMDGGKGSNPSFEYFLKLRKYISEKYKISNGPKTAKIAGQVQKDVKSKTPDLKPEKLFEESKKLFDSSLEKYKKLI